MAKQIHLTNGGIALVDDEDFAAVSRHRWQQSPNGYAVRFTRVGEPGSKKRVAILMHRAIAGVTLPGFEVDHKDWNRLNNTRGNLRIATRSQNGANQRGHVDQRRLPFKGVRLCKKTQRFQARIADDGHTRHLGRFDTPEEAARAYDNAAIAKFGEFAVTNFATVSPPRGS